MIDLKTIDIKIKTSAVFGVSALVLSLFLGLVSGVPIVTVLIRSLIMTVAFSGLGFVIIFIITKFVPEFKQIVSSKGSLEDIDISDDLSESDVDLGENLSDDVPGKDADIDDSFTELNKESFPDVTDSVAAAESGSNNLGKHIVKIEDGFNKFEPKLMAEAVRTMMSKDED